MTSGNPFSRTDKNTVIAAFAIAAAVLMCFGAFLALSGEESDAYNKTHGSPSNPVTPWGEVTNAEGDVWYAPVGAYVSFTNTKDGDMATDAVSVTPGFGLSMYRDSRNLNAIHGYITHAGTITCEYNYQDIDDNDYNFKITIHAVEGFSTKHGSESSPLTSVQSDLYDKNGEVWYVAVGSPVHFDYYMEDIGTWDAVSISPSGSGLNIKYGAVDGTLAKAGTYQIKVDFAIDGETDEYQYLTIHAIKTGTPVSSISISGPSSVEQGKSITLNATSSPSSATDRHVSWSIYSGSANGSLSSQSSTSSGGSCVLRGSSEGTITVRATATDGSGVYASKTITVTPAAKTYYLKYDANGGYNAPSQQSASSTTGEYRFSVSYSEPSRSGYTFLGWSTSSSASSASYTGGDYITSYGTRILYAVWEQNLSTYYAKLFFNANGGSGAPSTMSHSIQAVSASGSYTFSIPYVEPSRDGYRFLGWSTSSGASYASYSSGSSIGVAYGSSVTLYAVWQQLVISVTGTPDANGIVGTSWSYTPNVNYGGCTLSLTGPSWLHVSGGKLIGTPADPGTYNFTVKAMKNGYVTGSQSFSVTVLSALAFQSSPTGGAFFYAI